MHTGFTPYQGARCRACGMHGEHAPTCSDQPAHTPHQATIMDALRTTTRTGLATDTLARRAYGSASYALEAWQDLTMLEAACLVKRTAIHGITYWTHTA